MKKRFLIGIGLLIVGGVSAATISQVSIETKTDRGIVTFTEFNAITEGLRLLTEVFNGVVGDLTEINFGKKIVASDVVSTGGIKMADVPYICDGTNEGFMKYNSGDKYPEYCNGTAWSQISGGGAGECFEKTCVELRYECGSIDDGCGTVLECGTCGEGFECVEGYCESTCAPRNTCDDILPDCGWVDDGCGGAFNCGECTGGSGCINNFCVHPDEAGWPASGDLWTERSGDAQCLFSGYKTCVSAIDANRNPIPCSQKAVGGSAICSDPSEEVEAGAAYEADSQQSSGNVACAKMGYTQCVKAIRESTGDIIPCDDVHYGIIVAGCVNPSDNPMEAWDELTDGDEACYHLGAVCLTAYDNEGNAVACDNSQFVGYAECSAPGDAVIWPGLEDRSGDEACFALGKTCVRAYEESSDGGSINAMACSELPNHSDLYHGVALCGDTCTPQSTCNAGDCGVIDAGCGETLNCGSCPVIPWNGLITGELTCTMAGYGACIEVVDPPFTRACDHDQLTEIQDGLAVCQGACVPRDTCNAGDCGIVEAGCGAPDLNCGPCPTVIHAAGTSGTQACLLAGYTTCLASYDDAANPLECDAIEWSGTAVCQ